MQIDSRNTVDTLRKLLDGLPNVKVLRAEIILSNGVKIKIENCPEKWKEKEKDDHVDD